jgi:hypothetical protein
MLQYVSQRECKSSLMYRGLAWVAGDGTIITIFAGSTIKPCLHTMFPSRMPNGALNIHFLMLKEI